LKVIIFVENIQKGGVDTFCSLLINQWPNVNDRIVLIYNESHPGKDNLKNSISRECKFVGHKIPLTWNISAKLPSFFPIVVIRAFRLLLRYLLPLFQYILIRNIFKKNKGDELLVVNGGYPGAETCRIANIVWFRMGRKPSIHNFHNFTMKPKFGLRHYEEFIDRELFKSVKLFVSVSHSCSESLKTRDAFQFLTASSNRYIYNGTVDNSYSDSTFDIRDNFMIGSNPMCIMLGTYEARKGHKFIFEAFRRVLEIVPNAHLVTCGAGTKEELIVINNLLKKYNLGDNVHVLGFIPNGASLIKQADILLIGSQEFESFGFTAVEAMMRGKVVVATNIGGLPEVVGTDSSCGYIVDHNDTINFSNKIVSLLKDKKMRCAMGKHGRDRALKLFSADRMSKEYLNALLEEI
jgi:L-malate glycosyltransferase